MSLLQDPLKVLDQIEWYLDNQKLEKFPGAFIRSGGNLSRQLLEQILFILAFYGGMPSNEYMKTNHQLKSPDQIWNALQKIDSKTKQTYLENAKRGFPRIKKFTRLNRSINKWRHAFNEYSHFRNPVIPPRMKEKIMRDFIRRVRAILDSRDTYLILAAVNQIVSKGKVKAVIKGDANNTPGLLVETVYQPEDLKIIDGAFTLQPKNITVQVIPADKEVSLLKWRNRCIVVEGSDASMIDIGTRFVTEKGDPIDFSSLNSIIKSFGDAQDMLIRLNRHCKKYGIQFQAIKSSEMIQNDGKLHIDARKYLLDVSMKYH